MRILQLTLKKKWFDMIASGEKLEEYRTIKKHWETILYDYYGKFNNYDIIKFRNGYATNAPTMQVECKGISIGEAKPEWSDNWQGDVFIISLGKVISLKN